ncbi:MAG TPA: hypothetical protein VKS20_12780 [Candidatus Acidoferrales bacterium]|nr:hypothetical protein [Candidatus Acidoferrales bacterium]
MVEGRRDELDEVAFFAEDQAFGLGEGEIFGGAGVFFETSFVTFVGGEAVEGDESPSDVVSAFVGKKVADEMAAAAGNDAGLVLRIFLEGVALEGIDLVANHTHDFEFHSSHLAASKGKYAQAKACAT